MHRLLLFAVGFALFYGSVQWVIHSSWNKERLYRELASGDLRQKQWAAAELASLGAQRQLLRALRSHSESTRDNARQALWTFWFHAAGEDAYRDAMAAYHALEKREVPRALILLGRLTREYPKFAEGWNRRATLYWQLGEYDKAMTDCRKVLALNPHHFAAWQGLGLCQLAQGQWTSACRSFRASLHIDPYDRLTRNLLRFAEALRRRFRFFRPTDRPQWVYLQRFNPLPSYT